jgi:Transcriptional regulator, AbiEi antitoxin
MRIQNRTVESLLAQIGGDQKGVVAREELLAAGVSSSAITRRLAKGSLIIVFRGVYRVGHAAPSAEADYLAAVKACGDGAVLCGRAAAWLWDLLRGNAPPAEVAVGGERLIEGIATTRSRVPADEATLRRGIPVTTIARTLVDLAAVLSEEQLARAFHEANVRYRTQPDDVEAVLARRPKTKGAAALRRVVRGDTSVVLSRMEKAFPKLLAANGLPLPITTRPAGAHYVDCRWPEFKLTVELDSYRYHSTRHAWEQDRAREREAYARGDQFRRYTYADVCEDPRAMLRELGGLLR